MLKSPRQYHTACCFEFVCAVEERVKANINCSQCGYPHLDLSDFTLKTLIQVHWELVVIALGGILWSTPLKPLYDQFAKNTQYKRTRQNTEPGSG